MDLSWRSWPNLEEIQEILPPQWELSPFLWEYYGIVRDIMGYCGTWYCVFFVLDMDESSHHGWYNEWYDIRTVGYHGCNRGIAQICDICGRVLVNQPFDEDVCWILESIYAGFKHQKGWYFMGNQLNCSYHPVIFHMAIEMPCKMDVLMRKSTLIGDFPASHVWFPVGIRGILI